MGQNNIEEPKQGIRMNERERTFIRCDWCGIPVSEEWIDTPEGDHYCSGRCMMAEFPFKGVMCMGVIMTTFMGWFMMMFNIFILNILALVLIVLMPIALIGTSIDSRNQKKERPENSRRYEIITVPQSASDGKCSSCDEPFEVFLLPADKILNCKYCGKTSVVFVDDTLTD